MFKVTGANRQAAEPQSPITAALAENSRAFIALALISGMINLLMLTGSIFMIQVYDRVLSSRSMPTLAALAAIAVAAYLFQGALDAIRGRVLALIGERIDGATGPELHKAVAELPLRASKSGQETLQPFRDLESIRSFMSSPGPIALFDMPWLPVYLILCYLFHPILGYAAFGAAILLICITILTELRSRAPMRRALEAQSQRNLIADNTQRGAEVVRAMGMIPALAERWHEAHVRHLQAQRQANYVTGGLSAIAKMSRMLVQSCMLGLGAWLAIKGEIRPAPSSPPPSCRRGRWRRWIRPSAAGRASSWRARAMHASNCCWPAWPRRRRRCSCRHRRKAWRWRGCSSARRA